MNKGYTMSIDCIKAVCHQIEALVWLGGAIYVQSRGEHIWSLLLFMAYGLHKLKYCICLNDAEDKRK